MASVHGAAGYCARMPYRITCVCLGNICRSPVAEVVLRDRITAAGFADQVVVDSAGTGAWHIGHDMDPRSRAVLDAHGYVHNHRARQIGPGWLQAANGPDLLLAMDAANVADLDRMIRGAGTADPKLRMLRSFDPDLADIAEPDERLDLADPYYGGPADFTHMLRAIEKAADGFVDGLLRGARKR